MLLAASFIPAVAAHVSNVSGLSVSLALKGMPSAAVVAATVTVAEVAGGVFWRSGQTKIEGFHVKDSTFFLFREEYMVPLLPPDVAAYMATAVENVLSVLLIAGLASRLSAAGLLVMTAVIQSVYPSGWPEHILWAAALLVVVTRGPGVVSVDHLLFRTKHIGRFRRAAVGTA
jgi:putative oxidoreductase